MWLRRLRPSRAGRVVQPSLRACDSQDRRRRRPSSRRGPAPLLPLCPLEALSGWDGACPPRGRAVCTQPSGSGAHLLQKYPHRCARRERFASPLGIIWACRVPVSGHICITLWFIVAGCVGRRTGRVMAAAGQKSLTAALRTYSEAV